MCALSDKRGRPLIRRLAYALAGALLAASCGTAGGSAGSAGSQAVESLSGTPWRVTGYDDGQGALVSVLPATEITAEFTRNGELKGSAGCNMYFGTYTVEGIAIRISPLGSTRKACDEVVMEQEADFLTALQDAATVQVLGPDLTLRGTGGEIAVALVANP